MKAIFERKDFKIVFIFFFWILISIFYYPAIFEGKMLEDGLRFYTASSIHNVFSFEYFYEIFSHPTNPPQYRPLSFFIYQIYSKILFMDFYPLYHIVGMTLMIIISFLLNSIMKSNGISLWCRFLGVAFFMFHPHNLSLMGNDMYPKYQFPLIILLYGHQLLVKNRILNIKQIVTLFILMIISILCHEGSIVFPGVWLLVLLFRDKFNFDKKILYTLIPSVVYIFLRLVVFKLPGSGFMKLSAEGILYRLSFYFDKAWGILDHQFIFNQVISYNSFIILKLFVLLFISFLLIKYLKNIEFGKNLLLSFVLILPFALLPNHIYPNRSFWAYPFYSLAIVHFLNCLKGKQQLFIASTCILLSLLSSSADNIQFKEYLRKKHARNSRFVSQFLDKETTFKERIKKIEVIVNKPSKWHLEWTTPLALIADNAPIDKIYYVILYKGNTINLLGLIFKGTFYYFQSQQGKTLEMVDLYNLTHRLRIDGLKNLNEIPISYVLNI